MSCPFYAWRSDYYCIKTESSKPDDIYYRYCRGYDYGDCRFTSLQRDNGICRGQKRNAGGTSINKTMKHTCNYCGGSGMVTCPQCGGTMRRKDA